ncbi:platelet-derived growth factor receptor beta-like [Paramacrobiotus metropolitanus]|uniref:platelet-derived growth factor receptor beta-like n=1 Tax=Paramacrobiotus metropolitanus TaxID=2943436 RepID=UPI002445B608|nr:platelet-derived growth factor receptor beta-like [Paramacrobiotus metropolitanus]
MTIRAKVPAIPDAVAIVALMSCTISESFTCRVPTLPSVIADLSGGPGNLMQGMVDYADSDGLAMRHFSHFNSDKAFSRDYHVHKLVWTPESLVWYMDGQWALNLTVPGLEQWPKMYIGLGIMPGFEEMASQNNATNKSLSEVFLVDYVYRRTSSLCDISGFDADIVIRDLVANPCVRLLEVPLASLQIADNVLGGSARHLFRKGCAFGLYMQTHCDAATAIAIKTGRSRNNPSVIRRLLHEIETRAKAGRHLNIVNLLGVVINGDVMLLLEYCEFGSLTTFLRGRARLAFYEKNRSDEETRKIAMSENGNPSETPTSPTLAEPKLSGLDPTALIATLIRFAYQTSRGMEFLHSRDILHRDLAARNILLFDTNVVKISHFGMAQRGPQYTLSDLQVNWLLVS